MCRPGYRTQLTTSFPGAKQFLGLPTVSPAALTFFPALGARNAATGLSALAFSLRGDRKGVATVFALCMIPGLMDAYTCFQHGGGWQVHIAATTLCGIMSWLLVRKSR